MSREQQVRDAIDRFTARVRQETDTHLQVLAAELLSIAEGDGTTGRVPVERAAIEVARAVARGGSHARHELISRVITSVRRLDDATTLRGILDALADGVASETSRVAMLLVDDTALRSYRHHGYDAHGAPTDVPAGTSAVLTRVVASKQSATIAADASRSQIPAFMHVVSGRVGRVIPIVVAQQVVAVLYVEGTARQESETDEPVWTDQVEVLVRHASARLENVTSMRTVEVLTNPS